MAFKPRDVAKLLADCHRRCCICHRFCGVKIELDHMEPRADEGSDDISNAIPVCFECHAEIHSYNDRHPRGRKFRADELREHKEQWLEICRTRPDALIDAPREIHVGPLQAMVDELQYNVRVAERAAASKIGPKNRCAASFHDDQFKRAISQGAIAVLEETVRDAILSAYAEIGRAKQLVHAYILQSNRDAYNGEIGSEVRNTISEMVNPVRHTLDLLTAFLSSESRAVDD